MTILKTDRLILRPMQMEDVAELNAVYSHPDAMKYWSTLPHETLEQTAKMVEQTIAADPKTHAEFAITLDGKVIGKAGLWKVPEIGYILHPDYWGKGLGTEAAKAVINHGFSDLGLDRIVADVDPDNAGSLKMLGQLGFVETGREEKTIQIGGIWYDSVYLALTAG